MKRFVDLLIFDLDGTLVDSSADISAAVNFTLSRFGRDPLPAERIIGCVGDGLRVLMLKCLGVSDPKIIDQGSRVFREHYTRHILDQTVLYPGVRETLDAFRAKHLAVASNKPVEFVRIILERLGVIGRFAFVLGGDSTESKKPSAEPINTILSSLGVKPERAVMVGDSINDVLSARAARAISCYINAGFNKGRDLDSVSPDVVVESFPEIREYFH